MCVWLDNHLVRSQDYLNTQQDIINLFQSSQIFHDSEQCVDFITDLENSKVFLIISYRLGQLLLPLIHHCEQIESVYVFCSVNLSPIDDQWTKQIGKIKGIFQNLELIYEALVHDDRCQSEESSFGISFLSLKQINSSTSIDQRDPSFVYFQLMKEALLNDCSQEFEEQARTDLLKYCLHVSARNDTNLKILDEFENEFQCGHSIHWYMRECFLHKMLNRALWRLDLTVLYKLRYFIRHLYQQIVFAGMFQMKDTSLLTVYRGQSIREEQLEKLRQSVGGFLCFNNFLSTSINPAIAQRFIWGSEIGILFEMNIDQNIRKFPFIDIDKFFLQEGKDSEQEILFTMGTVFRINNIEQQDDFYRIRLTLSDEVDKQLEEYSSQIRRKIRSTNSFLSLLRLMNQLSQHQSVDQFVRILSDDDSFMAQPSLLASIYDEFGTIYHVRGQYQRSLDYYDKSLNIYSSYLSADDQQLSSIYNKMGSVYFDQYDYEKALTLHELALQCQMKSKTPNLSSIIFYSKNIAKIYEKQGKYNEAISRYRGALQIQEQYGDKNDPSLIETLNLLFSIFYELENYEQAGKNFL